MAKWFPGRRLSLRRVFALLLILALLGGAGLWARLQWLDRAAATERSPWTEGYVDVTATPSFAFEAAGREGPTNVSLAFVVSDPENRCEPSWGGAYSLDEAGSQLDLDRRLERLRDLGGSAMVSFGGQLNEPLALACEDPDALVAAYRSVIERYEVSSIDMDLEGSMLGDEAAVVRQAAAIARLQAEARRGDGGFDVWLTLPVSLRGLSPEGAQAVASYLAAGVDLAGVNAMTMNLGYRAEGSSSSTAAIQSLRALHKQLDVLFSDAALPLGGATLWSKIAATPMIGQNDVRSEVFTLRDARRLNAFANEQGMIRLSMWSWNRDRSCAANWPDLRQVSDSCSGVSQGSERFIDLLGAGRTGSILHADAPTVPDGQRPEQVVDDPATSPYPVWAQETAYPEGSKVVWRRNVYQAGWWSQGNQPDDPVAEAGANPWRLLGPVLPGETPTPSPTVAAGALPAWEKGAAYERGARVMFAGIGYEARWWSQGDSPDAAAVIPDASPWRPLTVDEIRELGAPDEGS